MRRISAILLLVAFSLPLIAAGLQDADANLPACCRRAGIHHCGGMSQADPGPTDGAALKSGACAAFPTTARVSAFVKIALPGAVRIAATLDSHAPDAPVRSHVRVLAFAGDAQITRGPPCLL